MIVNLLYRLLKAMGSQIVEIYTEPDARLFPDLHNQYKKEIAHVNRLLSKRSLPLYDSDSMAKSMPSQIDFFVEMRHSETGCLSSLAVKFLKEPNWTPPSDLKNFYSSLDRDYTSVEFQTLCMRSHIAGIPEYGYYIPEFFEKLSFPYPVLGSSITFRCELREIALKLNFNSLELDSYDSDPRLPSHTRIEELKKEAFGKEKGHILSLYAISAVSIHYGRMIRFQV